MSAYVTPRHRIYFDYEACPNANDCRKCVDACKKYGGNCIGFVAKDVPKSTGPEAPKGLWDIPHRAFGWFMVRCDACGKCVEVCPKNAITLVKAAPPVPRAVVHQAPDIIMCATLKDGTQVTPDYDG